MIATNIHSRNTLVGSLLYRKLGSNNEKCPKLEIFVNLLSPNILQIPLQLNGLHRSTMHTENPLSDNSFAHDFIVILTGR